MSVQNAIQPRVEEQQVSITKGGLNWEIQVRNAEKFGCEVTSIAGEATTPQKHSTEDLKAYGSRLKSNVHSLGGDLSGLEVDGIGGKTQLRTPVNTSGKYFEVELHANGSLKCNRFSVPNEGNGRTQTTWPTSYENIDRLIEETATALDANGLQP